MSGIKFIKITSIILSISGMIGSAWASDKENKINLGILVAKHFGK